MIYLISSHGYEQDPEYNTPTQYVPQGRTLITLAPKGMSINITELDRMLPILKTLTDESPEEIMHIVSAVLDLPLTQIRIYNEGSPIPNITVPLMNHHHIKRFHFAFKSGVFRLPNIPDIDRKKCPLPDKYNTLTNMYLQNEYMSEENLIPYKQSLLSDKVAFDEVYKGSVIKPKVSKSALFGTTTMERTLYDILEDVGPGTYIYAGCRTAMYNERQLTSIYMQIAELYKKYITSPRSPDERLQLNTLQGNQYFIKVRDVNYRNVSDMIRTIDRLLEDDTISSMSSRDVKRALRYSLFLRQVLQETPEWLAKSSPQSRSGGRKQ